jgi:hypothetical protein
LCIVCSNDKRILGLPFSKIKKVLLIFISWLSIGLLVFAWLQNHSHSLPRFFAGNTGQRRCVALCRNNFFFGTPAKA